MTLAEIALKEVGTLEVGGNNKGPRVKEYQLATWLEPGPWPWCAAFVCWCVNQWLLSVPLTKLPFSRLKRPRTAAAFGFEEWADKLGLLVSTDASIPVLPGDIIVFKMSHIGIAVAPAATGKPIETVEGNTGDAGGRDSETGDGVFRKKRARSLIRSIIRLEKTA